MQSCQHILLGTFGIVPGCRIRRNSSNKLEDLVGHVGSYYMRAPRSCPTILPHDPGPESSYLLLLLCVYMYVGGGWGWGWGWGRGGTVTLWLACGHTQLQAILYLTREVIAGTVQMSQLWFHCHRIGKYLHRELPCPCGDILL